MLEKSTYIKNVVMDDALGTNRCHSYILSRQYHLTFEMLHVATQTLISIVNTYASMHAESQIIASLHF